MTGGLAKRIKDRSNGRSVVPTQVRGRLTSNAVINSEYGFSELRIEEWGDAKNCLREFPISWIFRGHGNAQWLLATSLERVANPLFGVFLEPMLTGEFKSQAHNYIHDQQLPSDLLEWWALMQHHGAPTRLLDWTKSAYVAAFFALDTANSDAAIWAIDRVWCRNEAADTISKQVSAKAERVSVEQVEKLFESIFPANRLPFAFPVRPKKYNSRLAIQQGLFLCPGSAAHTFMENLLALGTPDERASRVVKITLNGQMRANAIQDLNYMNINRATLFPGLDGFAQSLRNLSTIMIDADDPVGDQEIVDGFPFKSIEREPDNPGTARDGRVDGGAASDSST